MNVTVLKHSMERNSQVALQPNIQWIRVNLKSIESNGCCKCVSANGNLYIGKVGYEKARKLHTNMNMKTTLRLDKLEAVEGCQGRIDVTGRHSTV